MSIGMADLSLEKVLGGFAAGFGWLGLTSLSHTTVDRSDRRRQIAESHRDSNRG